MHMHSKYSSYCHWATRGHKPGTVSATQTGKEGTLNRNVLLLLANQATRGHNLATHFCYSGCTMNRKLLLTLRLLRGHKHTNCVQ
jgi:hypothetical protein